MPPHIETVLRKVIEPRFPGSKFDVPLRDISRWQIGGPALAVLEPTSVDQIGSLLRQTAHNGAPLLVVGDMSNLLFDSKGFEGVVLRISSSLSSVSIRGTRVTAQAGVAMPALARLTADAGLSGLEHTVGIPGTLGGLVTMNGGSQRKGIGSNVTRVTCLDRSGGTFHLSRAECVFAYRTSALQHLQAVVVEVELDLEQSDAALVHAEMDDVVESRRSRFPEDLPNCGSTFLSDPKMYASVGAPGQVIEATGLKGYKIGGAQISPRHANFVVNTGGATSDDVLAVIAHARSAVYEATGYLMECEVRYVSPDGSVVPAHEALGTLGQ